MERHAGPMLMQMRQPGRARRPSWRSRGWARQRHAGPVLTRPRAQTIVAAADAAAAAGATDGGLDTALAASGFQREHADALDRWVAAAAAEGAGWGAGNDEEEENGGDDSGSGGEGEEEDGEAGRGSDGEGEEEDSGDDRGSGDPLQMMSQAGSARSPAATAKQDAVPRRWRRRALQRRARGGRQAAAPRARRTGNGALAAARRGLAPREAQARVFTARSAAATAPMLASSQVSPTSGGAGEARLAAAQPRHPALSMRRMASAASVVT